MDTVDPRNFSVPSVQDCGLALGPAVAGVVTLILEQAPTKSSLFLRTFCVKG